MHQRGGVSGFSVENFLSHSTEKFRWRTLRCFRKLRVSQNFMHKKVISLNSVEKFLSHSADKIRRGEHFCVSKEFWYRNFSSKGGGKLHGFVKNFLSHRTEKTLPGKHSVFQKISGREKNFMDKRGGEVSRFSVEKFLSHCTKIFYWRTLWCFGKILLLKIFRHRRGITVLPKFFVSQDQNEKLFKGTLLFPENFWYRKKFMDKSGHITNFSRNFCVSQCRKISWGNPTVFEKISVF